MRRIALALICGVLAMPLWAAPARVLSGEHDGFTRLVVELGDDLAWTIGRSPDGYELQVAGPLPDYDLSLAFKVIGTTRLAALWTDAARGRLRIGIACACHAAPFQFRPGTIVIDLKDGPPPLGSAFERPLDAVEPDQSAAMSGADNALAFAWADRALGQTTGLALPPVHDGARHSAPATPDRVSAPSRTAPIAVGEPAPVARAPRRLTEEAMPFEPAPLDPGLAPLRDELMREISLGAAQGVVDMHLPLMAAIPTPADLTVQATPDQARVGLNALDALPQLRITGPGEEPTPLAADGQGCPSDVQLDLAAWGDDRPVWEQISEARNGLTGEFDRPNPEALRKAVRFHLFAGFGAEARDLLRAYPGNDPDEGLWASLAYALDDDADPALAFQAFGDCDSPAAMWAMLSLPQPTGATWNVSAIQRSFSALPLHLRQLLGPRLVEAMVSLGHAEAVPVITNAIRRAGGLEDRGVQLMEAEVAAETGDQATADALLQKLIKDPGPESAKATVALIEGKAARGLPVDSRVVTELEALAVEYESSSDGPRFLKALILARALSGDFRRAFSEAPVDADLQARLWRLLSVLGTDDLVLEVATLAPGDPAPVAGHDVAAVLAQRFLTLGLPAQAATWLSAASQVDPLLAARVALARHDGASALAYLQGIAGEEALTLRVKALIETGKDAEAAQELAASGDLPAATSALGRARDWAGLQDQGQAEWQAAAQATLADPLAGAAVPPAGPLAEGAALVAQSQATRAALTALLDTVPAPEKTTN